MRPNVKKKKKRIGASGGRQPRMMSFQSSVMKN